jgi:peptidoglycan/xylan/chitin deacetylase (PgdA/CDA1 family)
MRWLPILMFHRVVDATPRPNPFNLCVSTRSLDATLRFLRETGHRIVSLEQALDVMSGDRRPGRFAALTFDDGYADFATLALPVLRKHGAPATVFLVSDRLGGRNDWDIDQDLPQVPLLSADDVRELQGQGVAFGAHGASHRRLSALSREELAWEVHGARLTLEAVLDGEVRFFAYPHLDQDGAVRREVEVAGYAAAFGGEQPGHERFLLHRVDLRRFDPLSLRYRIFGWRRTLQRQPAVRAVRRALPRWRAAATAEYGP